MKKALLILAGSIGLVESVFGDGLIDFKNHNIVKADGWGLYSVPFWQPGHVNEEGFGVGVLPGGFTAGLFFNGVQLQRQDGSGPAQTIFRTDAHAQYFAISSQRAVVPGDVLGTRPTLEVRGWQGPTFEGAQSNGLLWGAWQFTPNWLGGEGSVLPTGSWLLIPVPGMTGWGPESGAGVVFPVPEPTALALGLVGVAFVAGVAGVTGRGTILRMKVEG